MTEKDYNPEQRNAKSMKQQQKIEKTKPVETPKKTEKKMQATKLPTSSAEASPNERKKLENKTEKKKVKQVVVKKDEAIANGKSLRISTKQAVAICKFIKGKKIEKAIADLNEVLIFRRAVPMKGEIPHRKGNIMAGRYPLNAVKEFIILLKTLKGNANVNGLEEPIIAEAIANKAQRPYGRAGIKRKRTHVKLIARDRMKIKKSKLKKNKIKSGGKKK